MKIEPNNIYLGDAYELIKSMRDKSVDLIITDPPYEIEGIHGSGIMKTRNAGSFTKEIEKHKLDKGIDLKILDDFVRVMKKINIYIWCNKEQIYDYMTYFVEKRKCSFEILIWAKENPIPFCGTHYLCDKEYCLYFWEQGAPVNIPFERARTYLISKTNVEDKKKYNHPTIKPIEFIKQLILNSTSISQVEQSETQRERERVVVFDPFVGSGTTCVAAKELGRQYIGFEINPIFHKIAVDRVNGIDQKGQLDLLSIDYQQLDLFGED